MDPTDEIRQLLDEGAPCVLSAIADVLGVGAADERVAAERERCAAIVRALRRSLSGTTAKYLAGQAAQRIERGG